MLRTWVRAFETLHFQTCCRCHPVVFVAVAVNQLKIDHTDIQNNACRELDGKLVATLGQWSVFTSTRPGTASAHFPTVMFAQQAMVDCQTLIRENIVVGYCEDKAEVMITGFDGRVAPHFISDGLLSHSKRCQLRNDSAMILLKSSTLCFWAANAMHPLSLRGCPVDDATGCIGSVVWNV